jgi:hypothetical protein
MINMLMMKKYKFKMEKLYVRTVLVLFVILALSTSVIFAQIDNIQPKQKKKARISLMYTNTNNIGSRLIAVVKTKNGKVYEKVANVNVNFYLNEFEESAKLGTSFTNEKGEAIFIPPETKHGETYFTYYATIENDTAYHDIETELEVEKSFLELDLIVEDSIKKVNLFVGKPDSTDNVIAVEEVEVMIYVKRLFGQLPITEESEYTDEDGNVSIEFPDDLPGDINGKLTIIAQITDHETFGTIIAVKDIDWGIPLVHDDEAIKQELWSSRSNAPISLIVIINVMLIGIWSVIGYVLFQLLKIYNFGKRKKTTQT